MSDGRNALKVALMFTVMVGAVKAIILNPIVLVFAAALLVATVLVLAGIDLIA